MNNKTTTLIAAIVVGIIAYCYVNPKQCGCVLPCACEAKKTEKYCGCH